ncbi:type 2 lanthipeptide synthetase LanM family protein [Bacillus sp. 165]|uniref:type 2 lanthipeptide synthetase LanM family protein n=1 Tax=Bacillus sp. 165 TaxID=1529117 RepID=UPI001ADBB4E3|nr:type 2 lanthipeptide synthetase LanM family protein [Bacillus sp. 165]MBO9131336.1 type 2 lantipeptide synthetase LanM family protein [Bacillus sp. 165]
MKLKTAVFEIDKWRESLYLTERAYCQTENEKDAIKQVQNWCKRTGLSDELLEFRLKEDGLHKSAFMGILSQVGVPKDDAILNWLDLLYEIFFSTNGTLTHLDISEKVHNDAPFFQFVVPFLVWGKQRLLRQFEEWELQYCDLPFKKESIIASLLRHMYQNLLSLSGRMLIVELHMARNENNLKGDSPESRFKYFVKTRITDKKDILKFLEKYPTLARLLAECTNGVFTVIKEAMERFLNDYKEIQKIFLKDFTQLVDIELKGDQHNGGKSVMMFCFASGVRLLYKPRSLSVDSHFQMLLRWLNEKGANPTFQELTILDRQTYGWEEFVEVKECLNEKQVQRYYQRFGGYLAVLYLLNATDLHFENIIASGEFPYIVDLEAVFHNKFPIKQDKKTALHKASDELMSSVLGTGMLPVSLFKSRGFQRLEISGIGGYAGQRLPKPVYGFEDIRTDRMRMVKKPGFLKGRQNRPLLKGEPVLAEEYIDQVTQGFSHIYHLLMKNRKSLLLENGPIYAFANDNVRAIFRDTQAYGTMLQASLHPNYLAKGLQRVQLFDFMWRIVEHLPAMVRLVSSETSDLLQGDIPIFYTRVNSRDVWDSKGKVIRNFYNRSSLDYTIQCLNGLSIEDCSKQIKYIRNSMIMMVNKGKLKKTSPLLSEAQRPVCHEDFLAAAIEIGNKLEQSAIWGEDGQDVCWIGLGADENEKWIFSPLDISLYDGILGMALFYAYLHKVSGIEKYKYIAKASLKTAYQFIDHMDTIESLSAFHGFASIAYVFSHLSILWEDDQLMAVALAQLEIIEPLIEKDRLYDVVAGSAGTLIVALRLHDITGSTKALKIAKKCGDHLLRSAKKTEKGIGWSFEIDGFYPIAGLAHGAAGISWALMELYGKTKDERYLQAGQQALEFERTLFDTEDGNWRDIRAEDNRGDFGLTVKWCHGAAGIALGRLMSYRNVKDDCILHDILTGINTTMKEGFGGSHCLCHGDFGNADVLLTAGMELENQEWIEKALKYGTSALLESKARGWSCGIPQEDETPSLMIGMAGIGYGLLRLAHPEIVPSILTLGSPINKKREPD